MTGWVTAAGAVIGGVSSYMGAKSASKAAKEAAKPKPYESHRVPYMNEYLSQYAPWLMAMQQKIFESRLKQYGLDPAQFSLGPMGDSLARISPTYSGVGVAGQASIMRSGAYNPSGMVNPFQANGFGGVSPEQAQAIRDRFMARRFGGGAMTGGGGGGALRGGGMRGGEVSSSTDSGAWYDA